MRQKSVKFRAMIRKGNPLRWHLDIVIPNYGGRKKNDGSPSARTEFVLSYMAELFKAVDKALEDVGGLTRRYRVIGGRKKHGKN